MSYLTHGTIAALAFLAPWHGACAQPAGSADARVLGPVQAREEIEQTFRLVSEHHPDPFRVTSREEFEALADALRRREGEITIARQFFDLSRLLALVFDTHTQAQVTAETPGFDRSYPLRFRLFPDGLYIVAAGEGYRDMIGARVRRIADRDALEVVTELARYAPAESHVRQRVFAESYLYMPETYIEHGLAAGGAVRLTLQLPDGTVTERALRETWPRGSADFGWDALNPFLPDGLTTIHEVRGTAPPLYLQNIGDNYWCTFLDRGRALYLQVNQSIPAQGGDSPMDFHVRWLDALRASDARIMVIDLRNNPGGSLNLGAPIAGVLAQQFFEHATLEAIAVLIGPDTVSAGTVIAAELESAVRPVFVGAPTGSAPNLHLEPLKVVLPHSKLSVEVSRETHITTRESDVRRHIAPDLPVENSFEDYALGRDRVLDAALRVDRRLRQDVYRDASPYTPWRRASQRDTNY